MVLGVGATLHQVLYQVRNAFLHSRGLIWSCYHTRTKKHPFMGSLFHTKLHYYHSSHPWNSGKKTQCLQATLTLQYLHFLARPLEKSNIWANSRARRLRWVGRLRTIRASIIPVTQSFQSTSILNEWPGWISHFKNLSVSTDYKGRQAKLTRLSLAPLWIPRKGSGSENARKLWW